MFRLLMFELTVCILGNTGEIYERQREREHALLRLDRICERGACYPASGDLLIGREDRLFATSTCGTYRREKYCEFSYLERKICAWCDSGNNTLGNFQLNHRIQNVIYKYSGTRGESWWQSENGKEDVSVQLDLEAKFHINQLVMKFKTFRPKAMLVEISTDFGKTWSVHRYFAYNCSEAFPGISEEPTALKVACESRYSGITPYTGGEVNLRLLGLGISTDSKKSINFLHATNLRINFTKLHTSVSHGAGVISDKKSEIRDDSYNYYAVEKITVLGSCFCNGHAARCIWFSGISSNDNMVHGRCNCVHNTNGLNCEHCDDLFNDLPWQPAMGNKTNACKKCNCNNHATKCHFDPAVYNRSGKLRGGVCDNCQHNTMGINCELCRPTFYQDPYLDLQDPNICKACDCDPRGVMDRNILCDAKTDLLNKKTAGRCLCKANVSGLRCDRCVKGFWNLNSSNPDGCEKCTCTELGTSDYQSCDAASGMCG